MKLKSLYLLLSLCALPQAWAGDPHAAQPAEVGEVSGQPGLVEIRPRYMLMDTRRRLIMDEFFLDRFQLISFGYTGCPSVCPGTLATMTAVLAKLGPLAEQIQPIFISVDPERDTPEVLGEYVANFDKRIMGLTGSPALIAGVARNFKVTYAKHLEPGQAAGDYSMDHSVGMYLIGPDGRFLTKFGYSTAAEDIEQRLRERIEEHSKLKSSRAAAKAAAQSPSQ